MPELNCGIKIAHIVNPVVADSNSALATTQPITFESMRIAKSLALQSGLSISLYSSQFEADRDAVPPYFTPTPNLSKSILDFGSFSKPRPLPLIEDILNSLYQSSDADYLIYTNVDIILQPHFYLAVMKYIELGLDAFIINRRTISNKYSSVEQLPLMYSEIGRTHPGFDCFVFKRQMYPNYYMGQTCIGIKYVGKVLLLNLTAYASKFHLFKNSHLTFHLGDDRCWSQTQFSDYTEHNRKQLLEVKQKLHPILTRKTDRSIC